MCLIRGRSLQQHDAASHVGRTAPATRPLSTQIPFRKVPETDCTGSPSTVSTAGPFRHRMGCLRGAALGLTGSCSPYGYSCQVL